MTLLDQIENEARRALIPPPRIDLPTWIESNIRLPSGGAAPGAVELWPTQVEMARAIGDPAVERVSILKSVRVGFSFLLASAVASYVKNDPSRILLYLPTEAACRDFMINDLDPMFDASPALRGAISYDVDRRGRNSITGRRFAGGFLKCLAAASGKNFRSHTARIVFMDEIDSWAPLKEGPGPLLAERRALSYRDKKIVCGSSPTSLESGFILKLYDQSDRRIFEPRCPHCGEHFELTWACVRWDKDDDGRSLPETAHAICPVNGCVIDESLKPSMIAAGRWRALAPHVKNHAGFKLTALTSTLPGAAWSSLAAEWCAIRQVEDRRAFVNTLLAEGWDDHYGEGIDENDLAARVERFGLDSIPPEVMWITTGIDVGADRLDVTFLGHDAHGNLYVLAHRTLYGIPPNATDDVWDRLDDALRETWPHVLGGRIGVSKAALDVGDGNTIDATTAFTKPRWPHVLAVKGEDGPKAPRIVESESHRKSPRGRLFLVGTWGLKDNLYRRIQAAIDSKPGRAAGIRFSDTLDAKYFAEITNDRRVKKKYLGREIAMWSKPSGKRIEAWDCLQYSWAVFDQVERDPRRVEAAAQQRSNELRAIATPAPVARIESHPSRWMTGER